MPSELAEEYRITVRMTAGPFDVKDKAESTLRRAELVPPKAEKKPDGSADQDGEATF